jgi:type 1 glutamine amidotransferase
MHRFALLLFLSIVSALAAPKKIVLVAGSPSHGPAEHEFNAGMILMDKCLRQNKDVEPVIVRNGWPVDESVFEGAASIVFYLDGGEKSPLIQKDRLATLGKLMDKGVGMACIHYAVEIPKDHGGPELLKWIGGYYERPYSTNPINLSEMTQASPKHPISRGWKSFELKDEWYYKIRFDSSDKSVTPILTAMLPKDAPVRETVSWVKERPDGGRGFGFTGAHFHNNWGNKDFRTLVLNAILWTAKMDVPRNGAKCEIAADELTKNLDPKPARPTN